jgi:hypothetical protein
MPLINLRELRRLVDELDALAHRPLDPRVEDLRYTLCVSTGARDHIEALAAARVLLTPPPAAAEATTTNLQ